MRAVILSAALDTNGQNARYARAAERWGNDPTVVKALALGNADPAGVVARFQNAALKSSGLVIRSAHRAAAYFEFPVDLVWDRQTEPLIAELVSEADVLHLNNSYRPMTRFRVRKPMLLHHHGTLFRNHPAEMLAVARQFRMIQAVSTIDLTRPAPDLLHWLPSAYDVDELVAFGAANRRPDDGRVRIVSCPTNRALKATAQLETAVRELQAEGLPVDLELVEGRPWRDSLAAKANADIVFDQLAFGYGCNGVEAWGLGKPVVAGADGWTLDAMRRAWGRTPFYAANERNLVAKLRRIVTSAAMRAEYAGRGIEHVRRYHDERPALARLAELYSDAIRSYVRTRIPGKGDVLVTFENPKHRRVYVDDDPVPWGPDGRWTGDDPFVVQRLRSIASKRPLWGIREVSA